jgi:arylamine N-acetyltransferase
LTLHRAHLDAVPYENLGIMLGRSPSVEPAASLERVGATGRAGYCFHQNGALELVLRELGFELSRRHGHVYTPEEGRADTSLNHLVLVARAAGDNPSGRWWVDVASATFHDPVAVTVGRHDQSGFRYEITEVRDDGWSFRHDRRDVHRDRDLDPVDRAARGREAHARLGPRSGRFSPGRAAPRRRGHRHRPRLPPPPDPARRPQCDRLAS